MICDVCGGNDFNVHDGLYYCSVCNTQSQQKREEVYDTINTIGSTPSAVGRQIKTRKKRSSRKKVRDYGQAWISSQAFNIILSKQVDRLISLGVPASFRTTVLALWIEYLQTCQIAFMDSEDPNNQYPRFATKIKNRDKHVLTKGHLKVVRKERFKKKKPNFKKPKSSSGNASAMDVTEESGFSYTDTGSDITQATCSSVNSVLMIRKGNISNMLSHIAKKTRTKLRSKHGTAKLPGNILPNKRLPDVMTLEKTLCFLYLGLQMHQSTLQLCDIIRWLREGHLPGLDAIQCLPSSMKLQGADKRFLRMYRIPYTDSILLQTDKLIDLLQLSPSVFAGPPVMLVVTRFVCDLNLPEQILFVIHHLLSLLPPESQYRKRGRRTVSFPYVTNGGSIRTTPEIRAISIIIVALKLLFGLDDATESVTSRFAHELISLHQHKRLFIWEDWQEHMKLKLYFIKKNYVMQSELDHANIVNVRNILEMRQIVLKGAHHAPTVNQKVTAETPEFRLALKATFQELNSQIASATTAALPGPTLYPLQTYTKFYMEQSTALSPNLKRKLRRNFSKCTISYLLSNTAWHNGKETDEIDHPTMLMQDGRKELVAPYKKYWAMPQLYLDQRKKYMSALPKTFLWLVGVCSELTESTPTALCRQVAKLEDLLLDRGKIIGKRTLSKPLLS